ncbi:DNA repair protein RecO [Prevotella sp. oral taxon 376]|uniref:DNA repair protein RecO n=1 Tax=Prevotella sp. oral taxon 376 TaxID=712466 RepID=UPI000D1E4BBB|nr:DNA repair protein RecO [Prevotella sp. oral taxon 376]PTL32354.1 DNA repair protein RecO [Prevotella sp. oral taxon 376]
MLIKSRAIVLHSLKFGDSQLIVDLLTAQVGRVSFICRLPSSRKSRIKKPFFQPLSILNIEFDHRQNLKLQKFKNVAVAEPFASIPFDSYKLSISLFLAEFLAYATRGEQQDILLYNYIENSMLWLDGTRRSFSNFHLVFTMRLSRFIGFYPNLEDYEEGDFFDLRSGIFCKMPPLHPDFIPPAEASRIVLLMRMNYESMHLFRMSREERNRCVEWILTYYRLHIPNFPVLKSVAVLRELFS